MSAVLASASFRLCKVISAFVQCQITAGERKLLVGLPPSQEKRGFRERYCLMHAEWSPKRRDESCRFLIDYLREDGEYSWIIAEGLQKTPSFNIIFSILDSILDEQKSQYQIVGETKYARQTVAETLDFMHETQVIVITPEQYQGVVDESKLVRITEHGRMVYRDLLPVADRFFPSWRRKFGS